MTNNPNSIESIESKTNSSKSSKFLENTKRSVGKVLATTWIFTGSLWPVTTPTIVPASINTITAVTPIASTAIKTIWFWTAAGLLAACGGGEDWPDEPRPIDPQEKDNIAPTITLSQSEVDITWWKQVRIDWNQLYIWDILVASRNDNKSKNCKVTLSLNWKDITSWTTVSEEWTLTITVSDEVWNSKNVDIKLNNEEYKTMEIRNIQPVDILPIIWQIELGDKQAYEHIEHLRIAEATRIRDMMRKYWAGNHSAEEYQKLMMRLNTGMIMETPKWYDNYELIWNLTNQPDDHAHNERYLLDYLIKHSNFKIIQGIRYDSANELINRNPDNINILWNSNYLEITDKDEYIRLSERENDKIREICKSKNLIIFRAWSNIKEENWVLKNKIYHEDVVWDNHWVYSLQSIANWKNDTKIDKHLILTIWTDDDWDIDQTNEIYESSKFPVWFNDNVLFAWRAFPFLDSSSWKIEGEAWKYATSYTNYVNVAIADLCFQMFADVKDVDELLDMIRSSSGLKDHIRFNGKDQPLILMNPAWFFQKYLMPTNLPNQIKPWEIINLDKWYYKWIAFDIPWAEVKINWEWITYNNANKSKIKSQNPMTLEWRLNWDLCKKILWNWKILEWNIIAVDDNRNGLNINKEIFINM